MGEAVLAAAGGVERARRAGEALARRAAGAAAGAAGLALAAAALSAVALHNGFPLVYSDTGTYLESARVLVPNPDRPIVYGLVAGAVARGRWPWLVVAAQALLLAALLRAAFRAAGSPRPGAWAAGSALGLAALTSAGVTAGHLLPDVLAPAALLSLGLLLGARTRPAARAGAWAVLGLAVASHASLLPIGLLVCAGALALALRPAPGRLVRVARVAAAVLAVAAGAAGLAALNRHLGAGPVLVPASPVFLAGRMAETGLLHEVLAARCPAAGWRLCRWRAAVPHDIDAFVWRPDSPFYRIGGFAPEGIAECRSLVRASLSEPRWLARHAADAARGGAEQLVRFDLRWVDSAEAAGGWSHAMLARSFPAQLAAYDAGRQRRGTLDLSGLERAERAAVVLGALAAAALLLRRARDRRGADARALAAVLLAGVVANAAVCGALSSPNGRYQSRVAFLVPLAALLLAAARTGRSGEEAPWPRTP